MRLLGTAGSADITPETPCPLAGYSARKGNFTGIADRLELNALLLRKGEAAAFLLAADLLYTGSEVEAVLRAELKRAGIPSPLVLACASHTHFAPAADGEHPKLGARDTAFGRKYLEHAGELAHRLAVATPAPVVLRFGTARAAHSVNRRRRGWNLERFPIPRRSVWMAPNPAGANDQTVHLVRIETEAGRPLAVVWSYACHPVGFPARTQVTADFPGVSRSELRSRHGGGLPVLFLQGFTGNLRPDVLAEPTGPLGRLAHLLLGPRFGPFSVESYRRWSNEIAALVTELDASSTLRTAAPGLEHREAELPLRTLLSSSTAQHTLRAVRLRLGTDLQIVALSAEPAIEYAGVVRALFPGTHTIPIGYTGHVFGYLPTDAMLREGGYEAVGFLKPFGIAHGFDHDVQAHIETLLRRLA